MSVEVTPEIKLLRAKEFVSLLPLSLELAGLPKCSPDRLFSTDQMDLRVTVVKNAFKLARKLLKEVAEDGA